MGVLDFLLHPSDFQKFNSIMKNPRIKNFSWLFGTPSVYTQNLHEHYKSLVSMYDCYNSLEKYYDLQSEIEMKFDQYSSEDQTKLYLWICSGFSGTLEKYLNSKILENFNDWINKRQLRIILPYLTLRLNTYVSIVEDLKTLEMLVELAEKQFQQGQFPFALFPSNVKHYRHLKDKIIFIIEKMLEKYLAEGTVVDDSLVSELFFMSYRLLVLNEKNMVQFYNIFRKFLNEKNMVQFYNIFRKSKLRVDEAIPDTPEHQLLLKNPHTRFFVAAVD